MINIKDYFNANREAVNIYIEGLLKNIDQYPNDLHDSMSYSLMAGGKRLRPILVIASAETVGGVRENVLPFAAAIEMIHTYTLIHDDLPAIDDDELRRGKPTCHKEFSEATAILAGDALLTYAFEVMSNLSLMPNCSPDNVIKALNEVAKRVGVSGTIGGQMADILYEGVGGTIPLLEYIHTHKTGEMILASVLAGGILSGATDEELAALSAYAKNIGLAFQIVDDILDVEGDSKVMGKNTGIDAKNNKLTYPGLLGIAESRHIASHLIDTGIKSLAIFGERGEVLKDTAEYIIARSF
ncbi:MAG: polyprenyl synthetase family protein [Nitrospinota bacterium]|nr:polyprenyl synthetase family protein [Nitrospinota bacterium]